MFPEARDIELAQSGEGPIQSLKGGLNSYYGDHDERDYDADCHLLEDSLRYGETDRVPNEAQQRSITLALVMFALGSLILALGAWEWTNGSPRGMPTMFLSIILLTPGVYYTRLAYHAFRRTPGYRFQDIPSV
eukprot:TRINITY_DN8337_c0_g1_i1.p1 TRINITY_DN8337_c0_g1~~TRINITY_DN8337_c0_g1_i1.p1  ORF type:complete len:133 (+),score=28.99 TRINITY_DN8337_c0_g1_i1:44-442(+)